MCKGKAERPGILKVGGKNGKALLKGEYKEWAKGKGGVGVDVGVLGMMGGGGLFKTSCSCFDLTGGIELEIPF